MNIEDLNSKEALLKLKDVLTQEDKEYIESIDPEWVKDNLFHNFWNKTWLNLSVYSEVDKEEADLRKEMGI